MLVFAIAAAGTIGLGVIATRFPVVQVHLSGFAKWAGVFMQLVGLAEALRRLASAGDEAFHINPASPTVVLQGTSTATGKAVRIPVKQGTTVLPSRTPDISDFEVPDEDPPMSLREANLEEVKRIVLNYTPEVFVGRPRLADKIRKELDEYIYYDEAGERDVEANNSDRLARSAINLYNRVDDLEWTARHGYAEEGIDVEQANLEAMNS